jgi:hypothetical protein
MPPAQRAPGETRPMWVLLIYVALMIGGSIVDYGIGHATGAMWGESASLLVFLTCYFVTLWLAWLAAVRIAESMKLTT